MVVVVHAVISSGGGALVIILALVIKFTCKVVQTLTFVVAL